MKIVVFGGSGFLGSHVADELSARGHEVKIFDQTVSPYLQANQDMIVADVLDLSAVRKAVEGADVIYNFIALADLEEARFNPTDTVKVNILGNANILEAAREERVKRFIYSSSIYVYSDAGSFYRSSKQSCELFIENYHKVYGLNYSVLRYGSLYGPRADERNWLHSALKQALREKKITRRGDGEEIREYIHVQDAARLSADILDEKYENRCMIITGNQQMKIKDMLTMIREMLKNEIEIEYLNAEYNEHYEITPYVFKPQIATKLHSSESLDMGQGILHILNDLYTELNRETRSQRKS